MYLFVNSQWVAALNKAGRGALMIKVDWSDAYKHVHVRPADLPLQWFSWLGKDFAEISLIFGTASSPGIYDRLAKTVLDLVLRLARFPADMACQYLDDLCAVGPAGSDTIFELERQYRRVAEEIGVKLAPTTDPDKAFSPTSRGTILGVLYDTVAWTWQIPADKFARILHQIHTALNVNHVTQEFFSKLVGRLLHYAPLVPCGRFNINFLVKANKTSDPKHTLVHLDPDVKRQLAFWHTLLVTTNGGASIPIVRPFVSWATEFWTDAAGGSLNEVGHGCGGVGHQFWFFLPWGYKINAGVKSADGKKLSRKLSALELIGPLVCLVANPDRCRSQNVRIWVDNIGSVQIWKKGYSSSCELCTTLVLALGTVAAGLGTCLEICKITRRSCVEAILADELSKARFRVFRGSAPDSLRLPLAPAKIPAQLLNWVANPVADRSLGDKLLRELSRHTSVLGFDPS